MCVIKMPHLGGAVTGFLTTCRGGLIELVSVSLSEWRLESKGQQLNYYISVRWSNRKEKNSPRSLRTAVFDLSSQKQIFRENQLIQLKSGKQERFHNK